MLITVFNLILEILPSLLNFLFSSKLLGSGIKFSLLCSILKMNTWKSIFQKDHHNGA